MSIHILSEQLASQIAAGEVVERPASVVKELVENALDAEATAINVDVRLGGRQLIQVADDGMGITAADAAVAFRRHATSKLQSVEDLTAIGTLGFRGEALAAVAAVSQVTMVTRAMGESAGTRLVIHAGHLLSRETVGAPQGSVVAVEQLFFNTPARLKFLKSLNTEKRLIDELVTNYALAYPHVRFRLTHDGRLTFQTAGTGRLLDVLVELHGVETAHQLLEIKSQAQAEAQTNATLPITVTGFVSPPALHRANRQQIVLFVNGRWIKDSKLTYAIIEAYHTLLPVGRFPMALIFLTMPLELVDVNVHPAKTEVRFRYPNALFGAVQRAVREQLLTDTPVRTFDQFVPARSWHWQPPNYSSAVPLPATPFDGQLAMPLSRLSATSFGSTLADDAHAEAEQQPDTPNLGGERLPLMRVVGQIGAAYIVTDGPQGMYLMDQHAAHERVLYEQFMADWAKGGVASQGLVAGAMVQLPPSQATLLEEQLPTLAKLGFMVDIFGMNSFMVRAVPALLAHQDPSKALLAVVEDLEKEKTPLQERIEARIIKRVCKTAAVKAGQTLSLAEMQALIQQLEQCHNPHTCPHGRPTFIHISLSQLARGFGRT